jgi:hypothetical protein
MTNVLLIVPHLHPFLGQNLRDTFWSVAHVDPYLIIGDGSCLLA